MTRLLKKQISNSILELAKITNTFDPSLTMSKQIAAIKVVPSDLNMYDLKQIFPYATITENKNKYFAEWDNVKINVDGMWGLYFNITRRPKPRKLDARSLRLQDRIIKLQKIIESSPANYNKQVKLATKQVQRLGNNLPNGISDLTLLIDFKNLIL